ncbi:unnamed protein product [Plutella xylostella]|uniref:(diamondback moth) hypothetical protein n=1 Tax=Plutella xylostella TaxID=51655 RepID=A0A8S4F8E5_PLUXY|nr:unnamed protein product [Plutella xylostella]
MNEVNTSSSRVSYSQLQALHVFMEEHRELDAGFLRSTEARHKSQKLWQELAVTLNCIGGGSNKTVKKSSRDSYVDTAVGYVEVKREQIQCVVKAKVVPEHKVTIKHYIVTATINEKEDEVIETTCDGCAASEARASLSPPSSISSVTIEYGPDGPTLTDSEAGEGPSAQGWCRRASPPTPTPPSTPVTVIEVPQEPYTPPPSLVNADDDDCGNVSGGGPVAPMHSRINTERTASGYNTQRDPLKRGEYFIELRVYNTVEAEKLRRHPILAIKTRCGYTL